MSRQCNIRKLASFIGNLVASFPAVPYGPLFYRSLERDKHHSLVVAKGKFDHPAILSNNSLQEIDWWSMNIATSIKHINIPEIDITIYTDASLKGWGITDGINPSGGRWADNEMHYINVLELKAAIFGIIAYCKNKSVKHARIMLDNTTAVTYINNMGGTKSPQCNELAREIWLWAIHRNLRTSQQLIPQVTAT